MTSNDQTVPALSQECNICGSQDLFQRRRQAICRVCGSDARTRLIWLLIEQKHLVKEGHRVLHFAPETPIASRLRDLLGDGYEPVDFHPSGFPGVPGIQKFDLVGQVDSIPTGRYDLIIHSHVMEHVRCNVTAVLFHLHRALSADGRQVCSIPIMRNRFYAEDLADLDGDDATARFGQNDHVRIFGEMDIHLTLGMIFRLPLTYNLQAEFNSEILDRFGIHLEMRNGWSPSSVLVLEKTDLLLRQ